MQNATPQAAILALAASLAFAAPTPAAQDAPTQQERIDETVERLEQAFSKGEVADRLDALRAATAVPDARVVKAVSKGLSDKDGEVQKATLESLRFLEHPGALEALHGCYRRDRKLVKDPERAPQLFRAIGQHASPTSIKVLADDVFSTTEDKIINARLLALANIRTTESVETLVGLMNRTGRQRLYPHMETFRLALARLTGVDKGKTLDAWQRWWNEVKRDLEVSAEPPKLSKVNQLRWDQFWGNETTRERTKRRGRRGDG